MAFEAKLKYLHISPRKTRMIADLVRGKNVEEAKTILQFTVKKASEPVLKLLNSAVANAKLLKNVEPKELFISKITVDEGPILKRILPKSRGRGEIIKKRMSHVNLSLDIKNKKNES
ncbi:MAG: 50S ribosomal protein L22 [Candidatus Paceibacterota bacterium]|jgi:large subunit ribosomal protein L22